MNNSKTLKFKIATTVIFAIFVAVCLTAGIVYAAFAVPTTSTVTGVPTARLYSELWGGESESSPLTSITAGETVYVSTTGNGGQNVTSPYCVMRVAVSPTIPANSPADIDDLFTFNDASAWTLQDNGWYYYNSLVGNGSTDRIFVGTATVACHMVVELMQFASQSDGFAELWSPLAGRNADTNISNSTTTNGVTINSSNWMGDGRFVPFNANNVQFTTHNVGNTVNIDEVLVSNVITSTIGEGTSTQTSIRSLNTTAGTDYMKIYNNSIVPVAFLMQITPYIISVTQSGDDYQSNLTSQSISISALSFNFGSGSSNLTFGTYQNGSLYMISNQIVQPGEFINTLPDSVTFTPATAINGSASTMYALYMRITINLIDIDTLEYTMNMFGSNPDAVDDYGFTGYYPIWTANTSLATSLKSKYYTWLDRLETSLPGSLTMPSYDKLVDEGDIQNFSLDSIAVPPAEDSPDNDEGSAGTADISLNTF